MTSGFQLDPKQAVYIALARKIAALDVDASKAQTISALPIVIADALKENRIELSDDMVAVAFRLISPEDMLEFQELNPYKNAESVKTDLPFLEDVAHLEALIKPAMAKSFRQLNSFALASLLDDEILKAVKAHMRDMFAEKIALVLESVPADHDFWKCGGLQHILNMTAEQLAEDVMNARGFIIDDELLEIFDPKQP